jgi:hypothetical protein
MSIDLACEFAPAAALVELCRVERFRPGEFIEGHIVADTVVFGDIPGTLPKARTSGDLGQVDLVVPVIPSGLDTLSLLKNVFGVGIGLQMIAAGFMGGPYIANVCESVRNEWKFWAPLCVSTEVGNAAILHAETGARRFVDL